MAYAEIRRLAAFCLALLGVAACQASSIPVKSDSSWVAASSEWAGPLLAESAVDPGRHMDAGAGPADFIDLGWLSTTGEVQSMTVPFMSSPEQDGQGNLTTAILLTLLVGAVIRYLTSPAFYEFVKDVCYPEGYWGDTETK